MITGGRSLISSSPAFSNDAKKLLVCTGNTISIFSTSTGLQIVELEGHKGLVTSVVVVPSTSPAGKILCYCWTASEDGTIKYWDFSVPELIRSIDVQFPIHSMVIPGLSLQPTESSEKPSDLFAYVSIRVLKEQQGESNASWCQIRKCNLTKSTLVGGVTLAESQKNTLSITLSSTGRYMGICDKRKLRIWEIAAKDSDQAVLKKIRLHHTKALSTLAFHPTDRIVAAGDVTGRILIWRGVGDHSFSSGNKQRGGLMKDIEEKPGVRGEDDADSCTTRHWHSAEVKVLFFSSDGAYLYSGGKEGVLVVWQLDTGKQKFLPRIGSLLLYFTISSDPSLSSISCADNRIYLLKMPSMEVLRSIQGIKLRSTVLDMSDGSSEGIVFDSAAGLVAVCSENYCIQFYSLFNDREVSEVQVCERSHQPADEVTVIVDLVALSPEGSIMITVETRFAEEGIGGLVSLKFWSCSSSNKDFSLSTVVYEPHRDSGISSIAFHPLRHMAVTTSQGADFKVWVGSREMQQKDWMHHAGWTCHSVGSYKKKAMTAAAFSGDGSVLAVAAERVITLWDPEKNILVATVGDSLEPISWLAFIGKSEYIVTTSQGSNAQVSVWSMSKLSISWSYRLKIEAVTCAMDDSSFAILVLLPKSVGYGATTPGGDGVILLFSAGDPVPVASWFVRKAKGASLAFVRGSPKSEDDGRSVQLLLAYLNVDHEYVLFDPFDSHTHIHKISRGNLADVEETGKFGYASIYGDLPEFSLERKQAPSITSVPPGRYWETLFSGPSHNLPPLTKLCSTFLESLLQKRSSAVE
ncbi:WD repeat-containing protein 75 [Capsicum galapagoense]